MGTQQTNSEKPKWQYVADILDGLQNALGEEGVSTEKLVNHLATHFPADFPAQGTKLSVVHWVYSAARYQVPVEAGEIKANLLLNESNLLKNAEKLIKSVIRGKLSVLANTKEQCSKHDFLDCGSLIIVPMRVDFHEKGRIIGAFILHTSVEGGFNEDDKILIDKLSDRVAVFVRYAEYKQRAEIAKDFFARTISEMGTFDEEHEILQTAIDHLIKENEWFAPEDINIVMLDSFDPERVYWACENGQVKENNEAKKLSDVKDLLGESPQSLLDSKDVIICNTKSEVEARQLNFAKYRSYIFVPMQIREGKHIGFFILRNAHQDYAYQDEPHLLVSYADVTTSRLRNYRRDQIDEALRQFSIAYIHHDRIIEDNELYERAVQAIETVYHAVSLTVLDLKKGADQPIVEYQRREGKALNDFPESYLENEVSKNFVSKIEAQINSNASNPEPVQHDTLFDKLFFVCAESSLITKLVIIESKRELPQNIDNFMRVVLDLIGFKQSMMRKKKRLQAFTDFGKAITQLETLTTKVMYKLIYEYTDKVMSATNMYIALLDEQTQQISFPCFYQKDSANAEAKELIVESRLFDRRTNKQGRTEVILATGKPILIKTKAESIEWYEQPGHDEKIGNPLASWIGVPIVSRGENIGVIALFHATVDYLYSSSDQMFLENMATHVSDLLNRLRLEYAIANNTSLKEANQKLEENNLKLIRMQKEIAEREALLASSLVAQDITHRLNNSLGSLAINLNEARQDIDQVIDSHNVEYLKNTNNLLSDAAEVVDNLMGEVKRVVHPQPQEISIKEVVIKLANQVKTEKKLGQVALYFAFPETEIMVNALYRNLINCLHAIIENAAAALLEKQKISFFSEELYIEITIREQDGVVFVDIEDNGIPISDEIRNSIFELGVTTKSIDDHGYGLWRAKMLAASFGGSLELLNSMPEVKVFRLSLPVIDSPIKPLAFVIEDERAWRNIISRWLKEYGFDVEMADTVDSAQALFSNSKVKPQLVLLDIALDKLDGANVDGLSLISKAKEFGETVKVVMLTGYKVKASRYINECSGILEKVKDGNALTKGEFFDYLRGLNLITSERSEG
ncbi:MAG: GAF domain-containing protein [Acidithiobacillus sp.]|nr:GAF domain-containing protein [Acidithiobacillus sp.]